MNYELAKQLKDAGFKQDGSNGFITDKGIFESLFDCDYCPEVFGQPTSNKNNAYVPSLSELIESCGDGFFGITRDNNHGNISFKASGDPMAFDIFEGYGNSPEEAVARLWLELNKK